jgi:hypothetical protein
MRIASRQTRFEKGEDAIGMLVLLYSARAALQELCIAPDCEKILDFCIIQIKSTYVVSVPDPRYDGGWTALSVEGLLRMLEYLRMEISRVLVDEDLSDGLARCIASLREQGADTHVTLAH